MFRWLMILALLLSGCATQLPTYRYRLTVEVETPTGLKTGSSVIEVENWDLGKGFPGPEAGGFRSKVHGEAVAVDIAPGQVLFALLRSAGDDQDYANGIAFAGLPPMKPGDEMKHRIDLLLRSTGVTTLQRKDFPMFARFRDIADPRTLERVNPDALSDVFGTGVQIRRITLAVTKDDLTTDIQNRLKWLDHLADYRRDKDNPFTSTLPREISGLRRE